MSNTISTRIKISAYEKSKLPTKISDLKDDVEVIKKVELNQTVEEVKTWVAENYQEVRNLDGGGA